MKKTPLLLFFCFSLLFANAQTNVSGGIYTNTTWTKVNSPYIVTDTVVVFPGVILTIEPGVTVKFADNKILEIRHTNFFVEGTSIDPITFTSNSGSTAGLWSEIYLNGATLDTASFSYCNFKYAVTGFKAVGFLITVKNSTFSSNTNGLYFNGGPLIVDSSSFTNNNKGITGSGYMMLRSCSFQNSVWGINFSASLAIMTNCTFYNNTTAADFQNGPVFMDSCVVLNNQTGINLSLVDISMKNCRIDSNSVVGLHAQFIGDINDTITNCSIRSNGIGLQLSFDASNTGIVAENIIENNTIGIKLESSANFIFCNKICNNTTYDLYYNKAFGSNTTIANNYWCATDSATIAAKIYDGYDNINLGLVNFTPFDTQQCYQNFGHCSAYFTLNPDTALHTYIAQNMATGTGSLSYVWSWGDGSTSAIAYPSHTYAHGGFYTICLTITDSIGCISNYCNASFLDRTTNTMIYVNVVPGVNTGIPPINMRQSAFSIFPNPATTVLNIQIGQALLGARLTIYNITGAVVQTAQLQTTSNELETGNLPTGVYIAEIRTKEASLKLRWIKM